MSQANVIRLFPFEDDEALGWLKEQLDGAVEMRIAELARQFGWPHVKLRQRLAAWAEAGHITLQTASRGKVIIACAAPRTSAIELIERAFNSRPEPVRRSTRPIVPLIASALLFAIALGLVAVGLVMNARFAASFGQTIEAAVLLAGIGLAVDLLAVTLPTVAAQLWQRRAFAATGIAWAIWAAALGMTALAATGFASTHIGDAVAGREKIANESAALVERIARLRSERAAIAENRALAAIEAELQQAQPGALNVWKVTSGCRDVTRSSSGRACAPVLQLREALAMAERREAIDAELRTAERALSLLPAIATADPQAKMAAEIVTWLSAGAIRPEPRDIAWIRTIGLALTPSLAGILGMLALSLLQPRRPRAIGDFGGLPRAAFAARPAVI